MYLEYFRFRQRPFSIAPDPAFLYLSERHREALAHLMYGLQGDGGFVLVIGEVGTGKTTLVRSLMDQVPEDVDVAFVLNPRVTVKELLETLCDELNVSYLSDNPLTVKSYIDRLNAHLLKSHALGRGTVVIIDEAQNLSTEVLEQVRLLTNLETNERKLLRIILLGQTELSELLDRREMRQLAQRITARYHLGALDREDARAYIAHRLTRAGGNPHLFNRGAARETFRLSRGVPRLINVIADRALLGTYVEGKQRVTAAIVRKAAREVFGKSGRPHRWVVAAGLALLAVGAAWALLERPELLAPSSRVAPTPPAATEAGPDVAPLTGPSGPSPSVTVLPTESESEGPEAPSVLSAEAGSNELAVPDPIQPTLSTVPLTRPAGRTTQQSQLDAYAAVLDRWQVPTEVSGIPCNYAPRHGLQCLKQTGTWRDLVRIDRPVVLELWDDGSAPYYGALLAVAGDSARVRVGDQEHTVRTADLDGAWYGTYIVLWRMPPDYNGNLREGSEGYSVAWLRARLEGYFQIELAAPRSEAFDAELHDAVVRFQRQRGLRPDGIVGPATWIELNSVASDADVPTLEATG